MRSLKVTTILFAAALLALTPRPAFAWWDLLDYLSGPGPFQGGGVQVRLLCAGKRVPWGKLSGPLNEAARLTGIKDGGAAARQGWETALKALEAMNKDTPILDDKEIAGLFQGLNEFKEQDFNNVADELSRPADVKSAATTLMRMRAGLFAPTRRSFDRFYAGHLPIISSGTDGTLCAPERKRTFALEFSVGTEWAEGEPNYAKGERIHFTTATADVTYRLPLPPAVDIADVGAGGGAYFFSSSGFSTFSGVILEQFVQLHGPSRWVNASRFTQALGLLSFRIGVVEFPAGFDTGQFGAVGANVRHISGHEAVKRKTFLFNLTPLFRKHQLPEVDLHKLE